VAIIDKELRQGVLRLYKSQLPTPVHPLCIAYLVDTTGPDLTLLRDIARPIVAKSVLAAREHRPDRGSRRERRPREQPARRGKPDAGQERT